MAETKEMPLESGSSSATEDGRVRVVHGIAEVKTVLIDCTDGYGKRQTLLAFITGDQVVSVPNNGTPVQGWMRDAVLKKLGIKSTTSKDDVGSI